MTYAKRMGFADGIALRSWLFFFLPRAQPYGNRADKGCQKAFDIHYQER